MDRELLDVALAVTPPIVAIFAAWIAYQQWRTNRDKLRLDLYQRRFQIYEAVVSFYVELLGSKEHMRSETFTQKQKEFTKAVRESRYLFDDGSGIHDLLAQLNTKYYAIVGFKTEAHAIADDPPSVIKWHQDMVDSLALFDRSIGKLETAMLPYLKFSSAG